MPFTFFPIKFDSLKKRKNSRTDVREFFTIRRPESERAFQLRFDGFGPRGRNKLEQAVHTLLAFLKAIYMYGVGRVVFSGLFIFSLCVKSVHLIRWSKGFLVRKLIWSRGRLGRPVILAVVLSAAFFVFLFGEVFNSATFVTQQRISPDYLSNVTDIIPKKNIALTTIPDSRKRAESFTYVVEDGDTLSDIGYKFKISADALRYVNNLSDTDYLKVGQELVIPPVSGLIHSVVSGDTLSSIAEKYDVAPQAIADFNYILDTTSLAIGTELVIPDAKVPQPKIVPIPGIPTPPVVVSPDADRSLCMWPSTVRIITQYFSWYHNGLDIATPWSMGMPPLFACTGGTVTRAGWDPWGLGLMVQVDHGNGFVSVYGHMSRLDVSYGQHVGRGQVIGLMGNTGRSTGPHVHFMVKYNGVPQNPLNYMN